MYKDWRFTVACKLLGKHSVTNLLGAIAISLDLGVSERIVFATICTTRADKRTNPPTYHASKWENVAFVGDAFEPARALCGGEIIDVIRGSQTYEENSRGEKELRQTIFEC